MQGVIKLIDAAKKAGVKKFVLQTSILTNGKAIGEGLNPIFLVLNAVTGALDKKLAVRSGWRMLVYCSKNTTKRQLGRLSCNPIGHWLTLSHTCLCSPRST